MCSFTLGIIIDFEYKQNILQKHKTSTGIKSPHLPYGHRLESIIITCHN